MEEGDRQCWVWRGEVLVVPSLGQKSKVRRWGGEQGPESHLGLAGSHREQELPLD